MCTSEPRAGGRARRGMAPQRQLVLLLLLLEPLGGEDSGAAHRSESYARARDASQQHSSEIVLLHDVRHQPPRLRGGPADSQRAVAGAQAVQQHSYEHVRDLINAGADVHEATGSAATPPTPSSWRSASC